MKRSHKVTISALFILIILSCEKAIDFRNDPPYIETEKTIREKYDHDAVFTWDQYKELLDKLKQDKYIVLPLNEMRNTFSGSRVVVGLRHDIDLNPFKALEMSEIEKEYGIRSTYFILPTADYYGHFNRSGIVRNRGMELLYEELFNNGDEIGIHNDLLTVMISYKIDPFSFNQKELSYFNSLKIPIYGTVAHGSPIARATVPNYMMFSDFAKTDSVTYDGKRYPLRQHSLKEYGFKYEANFIYYNMYFSDSRGKWNDPEGFSGIMKRLDNSKPGDRIQILAHPDWWGKKPEKQIVSGNLTGKTG
jgi:hypothetical protein